MTSRIIVENSIEKHMVHKKDMIKVKNKKISKMDEYHYISVPKAFIDNGILSIEKQYNVYFEEIKSIKKKGKDSVKTEA